MFSYFFSFLLSTDYIPVSDFNHHFATKQKPHYFENCKGAAIAYIWFVRHLYPFLFIRMILYTCVCFCLLAKQHALQRDGE